jgi:hypothetical protein
VKTGIPHPRDADGSEHVEAWARLRRLMLVQGFLIFGFAPAVLGLAHGVLRFTDSALPIYAFGLAWLAALAWNSALGLSFRCPRCAQRFFLRGLRSHVRRRVCAHCGLPARI